MAKKVTVRYQVGTYSGQVVIFAEDDEESVTITARARKELVRRSGGSLPFGSESFRIVNEEPDERTS